MPRDESYVLDLCDEVLGKSSSRQHCFDFLTGDTGRMLPVDGFYAELQLVVEFHEVQHDAPHAFFDRRMTASGVGRGEQRRLYDQRRQEVLPKHGINVVVLKLAEFQLRTKNRLARDKELDLRVIRARLSRWLKPPRAQP